MSIINVLDSSIFNRIAAGEVVESPLSVVKELVENSIDAGASSIIIEIKNGGVDYVRVSDNGKGIEPNQIKKAFLPHATSKIKTLSDLDSISTLGFRGEALSSIASVAVVAMTSRTEESDLGFRVEYNHGEFVSQSECGAPVGTSVVVKGLFEKIPARRKFLKKSSAEESDISNLVAKLILANPEISFKYTVGEKKVFHSDGGGIESAIKTVHGIETFNGLQKIEIDLKDFGLVGYVSKPSYSKHNRSFQTLIINGRYVINDEISFLVYNCLREFLMTRRYPVFIFYITLPFDMVDVNVHPKKMEVKFVETKRILSLIRQAIDANLFALVSSASTFEENKIESKDIAGSVSVDDYRHNKSAVDSKTKQQTESLNVVKIFKDKDVSKSGKLAERPFKSIVSQNNQDYIIHSDLSDASSVAYNKKSEAEKQLSMNDCDAGFDLDKTKIKKVGTLFNTFILIESGECAYLIDQHAAHERILYNRFKQSVSLGSVARQPMLIPYVFTVSYSDKDYIEEKLDGLMDCGFEIRRSKNNDLEYAVYSVPMLTAGMNFEAFVSCLFERGRDGMTQLDMIRDNIIQSACKSAIKQGDELFDEEIESLLNQMSDIDQLYCPHGRPTVFRVDKKDLEKLFKRIV